MRKLHFDLETIPTQLPWAKEKIAATVKTKPPATIKKEESIKKWHDETRPALVDEAIAKTSFNGAVGEIICIGYAFDDDPVKLVGRTLDDPEADMLSDFMADIASELGIAGRSNSSHGVMWCGHYITGFDLRFLWQRMLVNRVKSSIEIPYDAKPWDKTVFDTSVRWSGIKSAGFGSADDVAKIFGFAGKTEGMDGSMVWPAVQAGEYQKVFDYCKDDVEVARNIYRVLNGEFNG